MKNILRFLLITFNTLVAVGLLLACVCCWVSPEKVWWLGFFGLAYMPLLLINVCFVVFWLLSKRKKYALLSLMVILLGNNVALRNVRLWGGPEMTDQQRGKSVKVLSFNVHLFYQKDAKQENGEKLNIFDYFNQSGADIICMQEFVVQTKSPMRPEEISLRLNKPDYHVEFTTNNLGIATYSRYPIVGKQLIYSDKSINVCMCTDLLIDKDTIRVYNIHLKSIGFGHEQRDLLNHAISKEYNNSDMTTVRGIIRRMIAASIRRSQQVAIVEKHIAQSPYPVIICGDFNDPPASYCYQKIRGNRKDAFVESGKGTSTTYDVGQLSRQRIDYILYSPVFKAYEYESPRVYLSDHYPVMCRLVKR